MTIRRPEAGSALGSAHAGVSDQERRSACLQAGWWRSYKVSWEPDREPDREPAGWWRRAAGSQTVTDLSTAADAIALTWMGSVSFTAALNLYDLCRTLSMTLQLLLKSSLHPPLLSSPSLLFLSLHLPVSPQQSQQVSVYTESGSAAGFCLLKGSSSPLTPVASSVWSFVPGPVPLFFQCVKCLGGRTSLPGPQGEVAEARGLAQSPHGFLQSGVLQHHPQRLLVVLILHLEDSTVEREALSPAVTWGMNRDPPPPPEPRG